MRGRTGFTLIEVLVALTVFAVGVLGASAAFSVSMRAATSAGRLDQAVSLAREQLALAVAVSQDHLDPREATTDLFRWRVNYEAKPEGLVAATVVVEWLDAGVPREYVLAELFTPAEAAAP